MTPEEREVLETTARSLLKLQRDFADRISGMDIVLQEMARHRAKSRMRRRGQRRPRMRTPTTIPSPSPLRYMVVAYLYTRLGISKTPKPAAISAGE